MIAFKSFVAAMLFAGAQAGAAFAEAPAAVSDVAQGFYAACHALSGGGIPDAKGRGVLAPYLSPRLEKLLADADAASSKFTAANKDAPPLLEGDIFSSLFEGISTFKIVGCDANGRAARCQVALSYHDPKSPKPVDWRDTIYLVSTASGWKVDDIGYGAGWDFANKGRLSQTLESTITDSN